MRMIGLLGGMSCESTAVYYRLLNDRVRERLGGLHAADCLLRSVDFADIAALQHAGDWDGAGARLADEAVRLQRGGAELILLCTNTMHAVAAPIEAALDVPFVHIVDATAERLGGHTTVALLGTSFTMEQPFYAERMAGHGITIVTPPAGERAELHRIIYEELCQGRVEPGSRDWLVATVDGLVARGATAVISGCTEIALLIGPGDVSVPFFDSTAIHVERAVELAVQ